MEEEMGYDKGDVPNLDPPPLDHPAHDSVRESVRDPDLALHWRMWVMLK